MDIKNPGLSNIIALIVLILAVIFIFITGAHVAAFTLIAIALLALNPQRAFSLLPCLP